MKYHLITFGCQMNKSDSERISGFLGTLGFLKTENPEDADLIILNSCSVRQTAEDRIFGKIKNFTKFKERNSDLILVVTGCMPGRDRGNKFKKKMPGIDLYFPISDLKNLPQMIKGIRPDWLSNAPSFDDYLCIKPIYSTEFQAFVPIQTGCDRFCSYCIVPHSRGRERCRPVKEILQEIRELAKNKCVYVELLGQVVNNYHAPDPENFTEENPYKNHFAALLWEINQIEEIKRIHFSSAHPIYMTDEVIDALSLPKQVNYLHLAVQSGNDEVLEKMNRPYTAKKYLEIIKKIKKKKPGIALGTDIIVGFPGEGDGEFDDTLALYKKADFDIAYLAKYSSRSGTTADKSFRDSVLIEEKKKRWRALQNLMEEIAFRKNQKYLNKTVKVLVEKVEHNLCSGWSNEMKVVEFEGNKDLVGKIINVKIKEVKTWVLCGEKI